MYFIDNIENNEDFKYDKLFNIDEFIEIDILIYELIDIYIIYEIKKIYEINFISNIIDSITEYIIDFLLLEINIIIDDTLIFELEEHIIYNLCYYLHIFNIPFRQYPFYIENNNILIDINNKTTDNKNINDIDIKINYLNQNFPSNQKTKEWYDIRNNLITASQFYKIFGSPSLLNNLIYEKCTNNKICNTENINVNNTLHWGIKYEPVTIMIYEYINNVIIGNYGCVIHNKYNFLGASPDGIVISKNSNLYGRMIEIKNVYNREINGIPKIEYWMQMQLQMETCDLYDCDFIETHILEYENKQYFYDDINRDYKGIILYFVKKDDKNEIQNFEPIYVYYPIINIVDINENLINEWIDNEINKKSDTHFFNTIIYWYLDIYSCVYVKRNKIWFNSIIDEVIKVNDIIKFEKLNGYEHRKPKTRKIKESKKRSLIDIDF